MTKYTGLWQRRSIQIADSAPYEDTLVYWLQADRYFADIRIPFSQPALTQPLLSLDRERLLSFAQFSAFAGTIDSSPTWIRWHRQIDFQPDPQSVDQGEVEFVGADLIERGESMADGKAEPYTEVWVPQLEPTDNHNRLVLELVGAVNLTTQTRSYPKGLWVRVGRHAIRLCDPRGYAPDFTAPNPAALSADALCHLMQFQADYSQLTGDGWQIERSIDPNRVGRPSAASAQWRGDCWVETAQLASGEQVEYSWAVRETAGSLPIGLG